MTLYRLGTLEQLAIVLVMLGWALLWVRRLLVGDARRLKCLWIALFAVAFAWDQTYWSAARHAAEIIQSGWVKWEFESAAIVVVIKGCILVSAALILYEELKR